MRKFDLINNLGTKWNLNDVNSFFMDPDGLGQDRKTDYEQIGNRFVESENKTKQKNISGTIRFIDYRKYEEFTRFIQHVPLVLEYRAEEKLEKYRIDVAVGKLGKSELDEIGLECKVEFEGLGNFYKVVNCENNKVESGKVYPYKYKYTYVNNTTGSVVINSDSVLESPIKMIIYGPCKNPTWSHYLNGEIKSSGKLYCDLKDGSRIIVDSTIIPWSIIRKRYTEAGEYEEDMYEESDFSTERFVKLGYGKNEIVFAHEGDVKLKLLIEGRVEYETV